MAEAWFWLGARDRAEALEVAAARCGRPAHLLEKDIWVVWTLAALYGAPVGKSLTFKGGTSLSKVYRLIDRFSEDVDLTCDIRELVPDLLRDGNPIPATGSQEKKISAAVRNRLPGWIEANVTPVLRAALAASGQEATLTVAGSENEKLLLVYPALKTGTGYAAANVQLEFGARATGEPHKAYAVACDIAAEIPEVSFPTATPTVMAAERTFWEKATAMHVYCLQGRLRGERYSRHWYDLTAIAVSPYFTSALADRALARQVAEHKTAFFAAKDAQGDKIDYFRAVSGAIELVPEAEALAALGRDYAAMLKDGLLARGAPEFAQVMNQCREIEARINAASEGVRT
ncbi:MAG: nucleotidyl transferase AbiEii/AbiGii toxin family protein [Azoarcus sp.]|nr:nucleotidyl transferase AbiEii/AbiGii toxin family protein [Azoarcus sp.]